MLQKVADVHNSSSHTPGYKCQSLLIMDHKVSIIWEGMHFCFFLAKITTGELSMLVASWGQLSKTDYTPNQRWKKSVKVWSWRNPFISSNHKHLEMSSKLLLLLWGYDWVIIILQDVYRSTPRYNLRDPSKVLCRTLKQNGLISESFPK